MAEPVTTTAGLTIAGAVALGIAVCGALGALVTWLKNTRDHKQLTSTIQKYDKKFEEQDKIIADLKERIAKNEISDDHVNEMIRHSEGAINSKIDTLRDNIHNKEETLRQEMIRLDTAQSNKTGKLEQKTEKLLDMLFQYLQKSK